MTLNRFTAPLLTAVLVLAACEAEEERGMGETLADDTTAAEPPAPSPGDLAPINRSGVRGSAEAVADGDELVVTISAEGLEPGAAYAGFLHEGRCADGGPPRAPLDSIVADADGEGSVRTHVEPGLVPSGAELFVQIHAPDDRPVACANVGSGGTGS